jgi:hypothetical protein
MILYPGECVEPVANKGRFGHIGCTAQKSSREGLWMKKNIIALANEKCPKIEVEHPFLLHSRINKQHIFKFGHIRHLEWVVMGEPNT